MSIILEERVYNLEHILADFIKNTEDMHQKTQMEIQNLVQFQKQTEVTLKELAEAQKQTKAVLEELSSSHRELSASHRELSSSHRELLVSQKQTTAVLEELAASHRELLASQKQTEAALQRFEKKLETHEKKIEAHEEKMEAYREESRKENKAINLSWGKITNKLGTMVEDMVLPSIPRIIRDEFGIQRIKIKTRLQKQFDVYNKEFDLCAFADDCVFINSTKSTLRKNTVDDFINDIDMFRIIYPEYKDKAIIGIIAALYTSKTLVEYAEEKGFMVLSVGSNILEVINTKGFKPKVW